MRRWAPLLLLGLGLGGSVFVLMADPDQEEGREAVVETDEAGPTLAGRDAPTRPQSSSEPVPEVDPIARWKSVLRTGSYVEINDALNAFDADRTESQLPFDADDVQVLVERTKEARDDPRALRAFVRALGMADAEAGDALLVELIAQRDLALPHPFGWYFLRALENSRTEGVAQAVRARFQRTHAAGERTWTTAEGWFELIAAQGHIEDLQWLQARDETLHVAHRGAVALAHVRTPANIRHVENWLRAERWTAVQGALLEPFARRHPTAAHGILAERLAAADEDATRLGAVSPRRLMRALGAATTHASQSATRSALNTRCTKLSSWRTCLNHSSYAWCTMMNSISS